MSDILDETFAFLQCKECPWYKSCVLPMRITPDEIRRQLNTGIPGFPGAGMLGAEASGLYKMLENMATAAQSIILEGCPVFISRLRESPKLTEQIKKMMQNWGMEEEESPDTAPKGP